MKTPIDLATTVFDFTALVAENEDRALFFDKKNLKLQSLADFCTVLVGWDKLTDERWKTLVVQSLELESRQAPIFLAPESGNMAHIMRALGAFPSVGEARRNGWNIDIEEGIMLHACRIRKIRGVVTVFKPPPEILFHGSWEASESEEIVAGTVGSIVRLQTSSDSEAVRLCQVGAVSVFKAGA